MSPLRFVVVAAAGLGALAGALAWFAAEPAQSLQAPAWTEVTWPFPVDQWGTGKAFACKAEDCGVGISVYLRAKIGFCNCTTGVADDEELDRVGDIDLVGGRYAASEPGRPLAAARMKGRTRPYAIAGSLFAPKSALAIALNDRCDVVVATAVLDDRRPASAEQAVIDFLNGDAILRWTQLTLGL